MSKDVWKNGRVRGVVFCDFVPFFGFLFPEKKKKNVRKSRWTNDKKKILNCTFERSAVGGRGKKWPRQETLIKDEKLSIAKIFIPSPFKKNISQRVNLYNPPLQSPPPPLPKTKSIKPPLLLIPSCLLSFPAPSFLLPPSPFFSFYFFLKQLGTSRRCKSRCLCLRRLHASTFAPGYRCMSGWWRR